MRFSVSLLFLVLLTWLSPAYPQPLSHHRPFIVVVDSGHDPQKGGAISATGAREVLYNDRLVSAIKKELETMNNLEVLWTRNPGENLGLHERADFANRHGANLFISVHHDSAQARYLKETGGPVNPKVETTMPIRGFSIFVSQQNREYDKSLEFARMLGRELRQTGRTPSQHHAEKIEGENRLLLDPELGVYRFDELLVLKETRMPALLFEAGVIVDAMDEQFVSDEKNIRQTATAIKKAVAGYIKSAKQ